MITGIILLIVGIVAVVACRAYVREPVVRTVGVVIGVIFIIVGAYFLLVALLHGVNAPNDADLDGMSTVQLA